MKNKKIDVLGTTYSIEYVPYDKDEVFKDSNIDGYCDTSVKLIRVGIVELEPDSKKDVENYMKLVTRHEIIHAFLFESGLDANSLSYSGGWAKSEEMVDWIAIQEPKIHKAFEKAEAL